MYYQNVFMLHIIRIYICHILLKYTIVTYYQNIYMLHIIRMNYNWSFFLSRKSLDWKVLFTYSYYSLTKYRIDILIKNEALTFFIFVKNSKLSLFCIYDSVKCQTTNYSILRTLSFPVFETTILCDIERLHLRHQEYFLINPKL